MDSKKGKLMCGSEWAEHEDCLVGDEAGLRNLINACEVALKEGECYGDGLGDYVGVKKLSDDWFNSIKEDRGLSGWTIMLILITFLGLVVVGLVTVVKWLFM